jgi:hypothetical protein
MKRVTCTDSRIVIAAICVLLFAVLACPAYAQSGGSFTINPSVASGGGGASTSATFHVEGSIGQHLVGNSNSGAFSLDGGFWPAGAPCINLNRDHQSFPGSGGTGSIDLSGVSGCSWTAVSNNPSFITITSGPSGSGDGTVQFSVATNAGSTIRNATITVAGQTFTVYQGIDFLDVPLNNTFYTEIGMLSAREVTLGCGNGNYCPNDPVTREQMAAFIMRALGEFDPPLPPTQRFNDVPPRNVFYSFIDRLAVLQITLGCTPDHASYCPRDPVLRQQMSAFLLRALGEFDPPTPATQRFGDVPPNNVFYSFIDRMAVVGITLGCTPDHSLFCPNDPVTRAQMAAFLVRAFGL